MNATVEQDAREHSFRELAERLSGETIALVKQEIALAKTEAKPRGAAIGTGAAALGAGAIVAFLGLAAFTAAMILVIALAIPAWAAALAIAVGWLVAGAMLAAAGKTMIQRAWPIVPETIESLKENIEWVKRRTSSGQS